MMWCVFDSSLGQLLQLLRCHLLLDSAAPFSLRVLGPSVAGWRCYHLSSCQLLLSLVCVASLGGGSSFPISWAIHVQQRAEGKAHLKDVVFCCLGFLFVFGFGFGFFFCMGLQNKNSLGSNDSDCCYKTFTFIICFMWPHLWRETSWCYSSCPFVSMLTVWLSHCFRQLYCPPALQISNVLVRAFKYWEDLQGSKVAVGCEVLAQ